MDSLHSNQYSTPPVRFNGDLADNGHQAASPDRPIIFRPNVGIDVPPFAWNGKGLEVYHVGAWLLDIGAWPVGIYPPGVKRKGSSDPTKGKEPAGPAWGAERLTLEGWKERSQWLGNLKRGVPHGTGICLGPGRIGDHWLADFEVDGEGGEESLAGLLGGEIVETMGWNSTRGQHRLFLVNGTLLLSLLSAAGATEGKREKTGVWHLPFLPGLEPRIGGFKPNGDVKQVQSVVPPTPGTDGRPREWNGVWRIAVLPESACTYLGHVAAERKTTRGGGTSQRPTTGRATQGGVAAGDGRARAIAAFAEKALKDECDIVGTCRLNRNIQLNTSAMKVGELVAAGALMRSEAESALLAAARQSGLGDGESVATIRSGLDSRADQPRDLSHVGLNGDGAHGNGSSPRPSINGNGARENGQAKAGSGDQQTDGYLVGQNRRPYSCVSNTTTWLADHPQFGPVQYDTFRRVILVGGKPMTDQTIIDLAVEIEVSLKGAWSQEHVKSALIHISGSHKFSSLTEWLDSLKWDGERRIEDFFGAHYGADHGPYSFEVGRTFFLGAVARAYKPGCKVDTLPVLMGRQGIGKSTGMAALCPNPDWFADELGGEIGTKGAAEGLQGKWLIEIGELAALRRRELETVKSFIARQVDHYRPPYGKTSQDYPRTCVFVGTTNSQTPLQDVENRRFLPIRVTGANIPTIEAAREQLWAEAVSRYKAGEKWWTTCPDLIKEGRDKADEGRDIDAWETILAGRLDGVTKVTMQEAALWLGVQTDKLGRAEQTRIGTALAAIGFVVRDNRRGTPRRYYERVAVPTSAQVGTGWDKRLGHT